MDIRDVATIKHEVEEGKVVVQFEGVDKQNWRIWSLSAPAVFAPVEAKNSYPT